MVSEALFVLPSLLLVLSQVHAAGPSSATFYEAVAYLESAAVCLGSELRMSQDSRRYRIYPYEEDCRMRWWVRCVIDLGQLVVRAKSDIVGSIPHRYQHEMKEYSENVCPQKHCEEPAQMGHVLPEACSKALRSPTCCALRICCDYLAHCVLVHLSENAKVRNHSGVSVHPRATLQVGRTAL